MRLPVRHLLLFLFAALPACGDIRVRYVPPAESVPADLEGEWTGFWQSSETGNSGQVSLRVQEFEGAPVVAVTIDNPFVVPGAYELVISSESISLQLEGQVVFVANLVDRAQQVLDGSFDWGSDQGTWSATWLRSLPDPIDLGGTWLGVMQAAGVEPVPFTLVLDQFVEGGQLGLVGTLQLPQALLPNAVPVHGAVNFEDDSFLFVLQTEIGFTPQLVLSGRGDKDPLQVPLAGLQVLTPQVLPFSQAVVQLIHSQ